MSDREPSRFAKAIYYIGLAQPPEGRPQTGNLNRSSRYGFFVSRRVDEDIDDLRTRVAALEADAGPTNHNQNDDD
jgi:hypothetical protein